MKNHSSVISESMTIASLQLDMVQRPSSIAGISIRFDIIERELDTIAFHVRQLVTCNEMKRVFFRSMTEDAEEMSLSRD